MSVAKREARASAGDLRSDEVVLRSATFSSRLVAAALGLLHVLSGFATISHGPQGEQWGDISRFVTFNHDTSRRITVYVKFWQGAHGHTRSTYNFIIIIIYIIFKAGYTFSFKASLPSGHL